MRQVQRADVDISIEPDKPDYDKRTFECPACDGVMMTAIVKYR